MAIAAVISSALAQPGSSQTGAAEDPGAGYSSGAAPASSPRGEILFLHFRWRHDSLSLVGSQRIPAATKRSRGLAPQARGPLSCELVSGQGAVLATQYLFDPAYKSVEYQEAGAKQLQQHDRALDSADVFVTIPDPGPEAARVRFYRIHPWGNSGVTAGPMPKGSAETSPPAAADRALLGDFPLE